MARQRIIDPNIWTDPRFGAMSLGERQLFIGLFSNADDEGRIRANPAFLRSRIFPYDDYPDAEIKAWRDHIAQICPNVVVHEIGGIEYIALTKL